jgi:hypothetical protein
MARIHEVFDLKNVTIVRETEAAIQVALDSGELVWIPLSQTEAIHRMGQGQDWLVITRWIADKKGLLKGTLADDGTLY